MPAVGQIEAAVAGLDAWLETVRGPDGYGGPVVHWWQQCLLHTGAGRDWRYEGILDGYVTLWERTGEPGWLAKAARAGDDLVRGQAAGGHFAASAFEANPAAAGTPHEAAADAGLLRLAGALRQAGWAGWERYRDAAARNLHAFYLGRLWDGAARAFRDAPGVPSFVPNKAATACEALFHLSALTGEAVWVERYALPTLDRLLAYQVRAAGPLRGAIAQNSLGRRRVEKYFPLYVARCIPALVAAERWTGAPRYVAAALRALAWIVRWVDGDGLLPAVVYPGERVNWRPAWVAALGDVLRAADLLRPYGFAADLAAVEARLLDGQDATGGIRTADGFSAQAGGRLGLVPDLRDLLHVAGWCDKAFRYLAGRVAAPLPPAASAAWSAACTFGGRRLVMTETPTSLEVRQGSQVRYLWTKGAPRPAVAAPEFWLR